MVLSYAHSARWVDAAGRAANQGQNQNVLYWRALAAAAAGLFSTLIDGPGGQALGAAREEREGQVATETGSIGGDDDGGAVAAPRRSCCSSGVSSLGALRSSIAMAQRPTSPGIELYKSIGANPVINGIGSVTFLVRGPAAFTEAGEQEAASAG